MNNIIRKIIHIDMDAFYASVEQRDNPDFKGKAVIVGGISGRGVVCAASYEARKFGVRSAMSMKIARGKCPNGIYLNPRMAKYKEVSRQIREIFLEYSDLVEPLSLDEAYIDVTENKKTIPLASRIAREIKDRIMRQTGLVASAGAGPNKFIAKLASDYDKPDGLVVIPPEKVKSFISNMDVGRIPGVGPSTKKKLAEMGISKIKDLVECPLAKLVVRLGKTGSFLSGLSRGEDSRQVNPNREAKSVGEETTFERDLLYKEEIIPVIKSLALQVEKRLEKNELMGKTITLKVKYYDFKMITRSKTLPDHVWCCKDILSAVNSLVPKTEIGTRRVRLVGVTVSNFYYLSYPIQMTLFSASPLTHYWVNRRS